MAATVFINRNEGRLRAGWRLILQAVIFLAGSVMITVILSGVVRLVYVATGINPADPQVVQEITNPLVRVISAIGPLVAMLLSCWIAARRIDHRPFKAFGFHFSRRWWADFVFGLCLGAVIMLFIFEVERAAGWITVTGAFNSLRWMPGFWSGLISSLVAFVCVGIYEELFSRGYQLRNLAEGLNLKQLNPRKALLLAYLISSSVFGMLHLFNPNASLVSTLSLIFAGLFLGLGYLLTGNLAISIGLHITWNFFEGNVFGFQVSGVPAGASFITIQQGGPILWTGGAFGPEAGLVSLVGIALGCLVILAWVRWRYGTIQTKYSLAIYQPEIQTAVMFGKLKTGSGEVEPREIS